MQTDDLLEGWAQREAQPSPDPLLEGWARLEDAAAHREHRYYVPLADAASQTVAEAQDTHRVFTGIPQFDAEMRGVGRGHMLTLLGYCMTPSHEVLTPEGWRNFETLSPGDRCWTVNPSTQLGEWDEITRLNVFDHDGAINRLHGKNIEAVVTDNHRWAVRAQHTDKLKVKTTVELNTSDYIPCAVDGDEQPETHSDAFVRIAGWIFTEGSYGPSSITIYQSPRVNADKCEMIRADLQELGWSFVEDYRTRPSGSDEIGFRIHAADANPFKALFPDKMASTVFVDELSVRQRRMLIDTLILGDGYVANANGARRYVTSREAEAAVVAHLFAAAGVAFSERRRKWQTNFGMCEMSIFTERTSKNVRYARLAHTVEEYHGVVWCPTTSNGIILVRNEGKVFYTHNSHSGKTLVLLNMLRQNSDKRIAYFCPDETGPLVLTKLTTILSGVGAKELEARVSDGDEDAIRLLRNTATDRFPHLAVFDQGLSPSMMEAAYNELVEDVWGGKQADMVIVDYVDLLEEAGDTPPLKFNWLKSFGKRHKVPMILIHQTSRTAGSDGKAMKIDSGNFGGEQHATFMIGVRRKKNSILSELADQRSKATPNLDRIRELEHDLLIHEYTITLNLVKNKRPGGRTVDEIDFELMIKTGEIRQLAPGQYPEQWSQNHSLAAADAAKATTPEPTLDEVEYDDDGYGYSDYS